MKENRTLVVCSLLSLLLLTVHLTDDIVRGISRAEPANLLIVVFLGGLLYGTLELADRRAGHVIMFFIGLLAAAMPFLHMRGARYGEIAASSGGFFFVFTLLAVGGIGLFVVARSVVGLWRLRPGQPR